MANWNAVCPRNWSACASANTRLLTDQQKKVVSVFLPEVKIQDSIRGTAFFSILLFYNQATGITQKKKKSKLLSSRGCGQCDCRRNT